MGRTIKVTIGGEPGFTIAPVHIVPEGEGAVPQTLYEAIQSRQCHLFYERWKDYTRFQRICAWLAVRRDDPAGWHVPWYIALAFSICATGVCLVMGVFEGGQFSTPVLQLEPPMLMKAVIFALPLVAYSVARQKTRNWQDTVLPPWLHAFHDRRHKEYAAIAADAEAFNAWAATAQVPPEMQADVTEVADARRKEIHDRMLAYLADMDKALKHRVQVERLLASRRMVDAAFPEANGRLTLAVAPRVAMLATADTLMNEAIELGMPTDELLSVRQLTSGS